MVLSKSSKVVSNTFGKKPSPIPRGYKRIPFIVGGVGLPNGWDLRVCCNFLGFL